MRGKILACIRESPQLWPAQGLSSNTHLSAALLARQSFRRSGQDRLIWLVFDTAYEQPFLVARHYALPEFNSLLEQEFSWCQSLFRTFPALVPEPLVLKRIDDHVVFFERGLEGNTIRTLIARQARLDSSQPAVGSMIENHFESASHIIAQLNTTQEKSTPGAVLAEIGSAFLATRARLTHLSPDDALLVDSLFARALTIAQGLPSQSRIVNFDFVPANISLSPGGRVKIFDWEYQRRSSLAFCEPIKFIHWYIHALSQHGLFGFNREFSKALDQFLSGVIQLPEPALLNLLKAGGIPADDPAMLRSLWALFLLIESDLTGSVAADHVQSTLSQMPLVRVILQAEGIHNARLLAANTIATLQEQIETLKGQIETLQTDVAAARDLTAKVEENEVTIRARDEKIAQLRIELSQVEVDSTRNLKARAEEYETTIRHRDEAISWLKDEITVLQTGLTTIKGSRFWKMRDAYWAFKERLQALATAWRRKPESLTGPNLPRANLAASDDAVYETPAQAGRVLAEVAFASLGINPALSTSAVSSVLAAPPSAQPSARADVFCFSIIDWGFRFQRPQQIMAQFAAHGHRVFYLNVTRYLPSNARPPYEIKEIRPNLYEVFLSSRRALDIYRTIVSGEIADHILEALEAFRKDFSLTDTIAYVMKVSWGEVALETRSRWGWRVIYDCMDDWDTFPGIRPELVAMEPALVQASDLLIVTAQRLFEKWQGQARSMVLVRNGVDYEFYRRNLQPNSILGDLSHPIVGYFGAIAEWFDLDLLIQVAARRPSYTFVLLGGTFNIEEARLRALPNVHLLGQQPYEMMPQYLYHFDAGIIPFKINPVTEATDPVKLYEYFASGRPVVTTALPELAHYQKYVYIAHNPDEFMQMLDEALAENNPGLEAERRTLAQSHTWAGRYRQIWAGLTQTVSSASIIIVTHNNLALTKLCLESILQFTDYPIYEIIVVDNNSTDGTQQYLRYLAGQSTLIRPILNQSNAGFARANNQGLVCANGQILVLLNNDTMVTRGWLTRLVNHLKDETVGLVGPVTNFVGNEAKVAAPYKTWKEMEAYAQAVNRQHEGQIADIHVLAMYCIAFRRQTWERIGPLDEQFGIGMFEDDDYAMRIRQQDMRVVCALDVFIHHFGQAAFSKLIQEGRYDRLFEENKRKYESKWQVEWVPHRHGRLTGTPHTHTRSRLSGTSSNQGSNDNGTHKQ